MLANDTEDEKQKEMLKALIELLRGANDIGKMDELSVRTMDDCGLL